MVDPLAGITAGSAFVVMGVALAGIYKGWRERMDPIEADEKKERAALRADLSARGREMLDRMDRDLARQTADADHYRERWADVEKALDASRDRERQWVSRAHVLGHEVQNLRQIIDTAREKAGLPPIVWFDETLPEIDAIEADNRRRLALKQGLLPPA